MNSVLLYVVNVLPGWGAALFLTPEAAQVVPVLNAVFIIGIVGNLVNVVVDRRWMRAVTETLSSTVSLLGIIMILSLFPFNPDDSTVHWSLITRVVLGFAAVACVVSIIVQVAVFVTGGRYRSGRNAG